MSVEFFWRSDDYLDKPVNLRELLVRARNVLRRCDGPRKGIATEQPAQTEFHGWLLDTAARRLQAPDGSDVRLTRGEFELLSFFVRRSGQVLERGQLLDCLSAREWKPYDRSVDVLIGRLRSKIEKDPKDPRLIVTVHGVGYVFLGQIDSPAPS